MKNNRITPRRGRGRPREGKAPARKVFEPIKCKNCRVKFKPVRSDQKFHSDACRKEFHQYGKMSIAKITERVERRLKSSFASRLEVLESQMAGVLEQLPITDENIPF